MVKPRQMRRQARKMRRYGMQPMIVINSDEPMPDMIVILIGRWLYRYRSELAPLYITAVTVCAAFILHATHPTWWPFLLGVTIVSTGTPIVVGKRLVLARITERIYAALVPLATWGWLTAATVIGPINPWLLRLLLGTLVLAVP